MFDDRLIDLADDVILLDVKAANLQKFTDAMTCLGSKIGLNISVEKRNA